MTPDTPWNTRLSLTNSPNSHLLGYSRQYLPCFVRSNGYGGGGGQGRISRGIHELPKVLLGPVILNHSTPCGRPPLKKPFGCFRDGGLQLSSTPLDTPCHTPLIRGEHGWMDGVGLNGFTWRRNDCQELFCLPLHLLHSFTDTAWNVSSDL
jgi:hypothetical protein